MAGKVSARRIYSLDSGADIRHRQAHLISSPARFPPAGPKGHGSKPASQSERRRALSDEPRSLSLSLAKKTRRETIQRLEASAVARLRVEKYSHNGTVGGGCLSVDGPAGELTRGPA